MALAGLAADARLTTDVCVVGLGGGGLSAVCELARRGADVVGLDAGHVASGASGRNGGFLIAGTALFHHDAVAQLGRERAVRLYQLTLEEIDRTLEEAPGVIATPGLLRVGASLKEEADCREQLLAMQADGLPAEEYDGPEGKGLLATREGTLDPVARCAALAANARAGGAQMYGAARVTRLVASGDHWRVDIEGGAQVSASRVIVAIDGGLELVLPELSPRVRTARAQMLATAPDPDVAIPRPVYSRWGYEYWQQRPDGRILLGGYRDRGRDDEWTFEALPAGAVQSALEHHLRTTLASTAAVEQRWAGLIAFTDDRLPVLEEVRPGVIATGAFSGHGNLLSAICGRAAAARALGDHADPLA